MSSVDEAEFIALVNFEGQYSLWPSFKAIPEGWHDADCRGTKSQCIAFIEKHWTDMRPRSLRIKLDH